MRKEYKPEEVPLYEKLSSKGQSVIYLRIGDLHLLEGTYDFKFRLYDRLPENCVLTRTEYVQNRRIKLDELTGITLRYQQEFGSVRAGVRSMPIGVRHAPPLGWQYDLIQGFASLGVQIRPEWVIHPNELQTYKQKYGL